MNSKQEDSQEKIPHTELRVIITKETVESITALAKYYKVSTNTLVEAALRLYLNMHEERTR